MTRGESPWSVCELLTSGEPLEVPRPGPLSHPTEGEMHPAGQVPKKLGLQGFRFSRWKACIPDLAARSFLGAVGTAGAGGDGPRGFRAPLPDHCTPPGFPPSPPAAAEADAADPCMEVSWFSQVPWLPAG